jgi:hypothetical protein
MSQQTSDGMVPALVAMSSDEDESSTIEAANNGNGGHAEGEVAAASEDVEMGADPDMPALVHVSDESGDEDAEHQPHASARPSAAMGASAQNDAVRAVLFSSHEWIRRGLMPRTFRRWVPAPSEARMWQPLSLFLPPYNTLVGDGCFHTSSPLSPLPSPLSPLLPAVHTRSLS